MIMVIVFSSRYMVVSVRFGWWCSWLVVVNVVGVCNVKLMGVDIEVFGLVCCVVVV